MESGAPGPGSRQSPLGNRPHGDLRIDLLGPFPELRYCKDRSRRQRWGGGRLSLLAFLVSDDTGYQGRHRGRARAVRAARWTAAAFLILGPLLVGPRAADASVSFWGSSADGSSAFFTTDDPLVGADADTQPDVYERSGRTTTILSQGPINGNGPFAATFLKSSTCLLYTSDAADE